MTIKTKIIFSTLVLAFMVVPMTYVHAMTIAIEPPQEPLQVGKTSLIKVVLENRDKTKEINALEGSLKISSPSDVVSINTGGSIFNLWPIKPSLDKDRISFTGGTQSGVFGSSLQVFMIAVKPKNNKTIQVSFDGVTAYLSDGTGTKVPVSGSPATITVLKTTSKNNELSDLLASDATPPPSFTIDLGHDSALYDGKYFISFYATDNESGIKRYEVTESGYPTVRSGSVYVLQNQSLTGTVEVKAIDNAGNERVKTVSLKTGIPRLRMILIIIATLAFLIVLYRTVRIIRKKS